MDPLELIDEEPSEEDVREAVKNSLMKEKREKPFEVPELADLEKEMKIERIIESPERMTDLYELARKQGIKGVREKINNKNKNELCVFCGPPGTGKSYSGIDHALEIDPSFVIEDQLTSGRYGAGDFIRLLNSGTLRKGNAVIIDEAGVMVARREWYTQLNKAIDTVLQTFRSDNLCVIFTTPSLDYIDTHCWKLFSHYYETIEVNEDERIVYVKPFNMSYYPRTGKTYFKYPNFNYNGMNIQVQRLKYPSPPQGVIDRYEIMKKKSNKDTKTLAEIDIQRAIEKEGGKHVVAENIADEIIRKGELIRRTSSGKVMLSHYDIIRVYKCGHSFAALVRSNVLSKIGTEIIKK